MSSNAVISESGFGDSARAFNVVSVLKAMLLAALAGWALSWIYGPAEHYSPLVYGNILLTYGMGFAIGLVAQNRVRAYRVNMILPAILIGAVAGAIGLWASWLSYIWVITGFDFAEYIDFFVHPVYIYRVGVYLAHDPVWTIGRSGADPAVLYYFAWVCEAVLFIGLPAMMCKNYVTENMLCGQCHDWLTSTGDVTRFEMPEEGYVMVRDGLTAGDAGPLLGLGKHPAAEAEESGDSTEWLEAAGFACPNCQDIDSYITLSHVRLKPDKNKELKRVEKVLVRFVPVDLECEQRLFENANEAETETAVVDDSGLSEVEEQAV